MKAPLIGQTFTVHGTVEIFPMDNPWIYVSVPKKYVKLFADFMDRGLVAVTVTLGSSTWDTSLLPKGDGTLFIALNAKVRKAEGIGVGQRVQLQFMLRQR